MRYAALFLALLAEGDLPPEGILLGRIRSHAAATLARQPNYTCLQSIERSRRRAHANKYEPIDTLRLEVALVGGRELFSWPGAGKFEDAKITDLVHGGAIGNGNFALHARSVFMSNSPTFTYVGERVRDGRRAFRFDYKVPQSSSGYTLKVGELKGIVGYRGSFWVDPGTLDLIRLEVIADEIPAHLPVASASDGIEYSRLRIGAGQFLLPDTSDMTITDLQGNESRNRSRFLRCRQYAGESVLTFDDAPEHASQTASKPPKTIGLPAGLELEMKLAAELDSSKTAVGDAIEAIVDRGAKYKGQPIVPKGARAMGRVTRLEYRSMPIPHYIVSLNFSTLEFDGHQAALHGRVQSLSGAPWPSSQNHAMRQLDYIYRNREEGAFPQPGMRVRLARGLRFLWRAEAANEESK